MQKLSIIEIITWVIVLGLICGGINLYLCTPVFEYLSDAVSWDKYEIDREEYFKIYVALFLFLPGIILFAFYIPFMETHYGDVKHENSFFDNNSFAKFYLSVLAWGVANFGLGFLLLFFLCSSAFGPVAFIPFLVLLLSFFPALTLVIFIILNYFYRINAFLDDIIILIVLSYTAMLITCLIGFFIDNTHKWNDFVCYYYVYIWHITQALGFALMIRKKDKTQEAILL